TAADRRRTRGRSRPPEHDARTSGKVNDGRGTQREQADGYQTREAGHAARGLAARGDTPREAEVGQPVGEVVAGSGDAHEVANSHRWDPAADGARESGAQLREDVFLIIGRAHV